MNNFLSFVIAHTIPYYWRVKKYLSEFLLLGSYIALIFHTENKIIMNERLQKLFVMIRLQKKFVYCRIPLLLYKLLISS